MSGGAIGFRAAMEIVEREAARVRLQPRDVETVDLLRGVGRAIAEDVIADAEMPRFARSTRDGYAVRAADIADGRWVKVVGELHAGKMWSGKLEAHEGIAIMTGAPVPEDADCVVMLEHVEREGNRVRMAGGRSVKAGDFVAAAGSEARAGDVVLKKGTILEAAQIGAAAMCGRADISVYKRPRVAVLATGDELVGVQDMPAGGEIRNSNSYELAAAVMRCNGEAFVMDPAPDREEVLQQRIAEAAKRDLIVMSGGVSMGTRDLVGPVLREHFGAEFFFAGVAMRPGKPVMFGKTREGKYFFGLPGNPVSSLVTFLLFVRPMLAAMAGETGEIRRWVHATMADEIVSPAGLTRFLPAKLQWSEGRAVAELVKWHGSGDLAALSQADGCVMLDEDCTRVEQGATVEVLLMS